MAPIKGCRMLDILIGIREFNLNEAFIFQVNLSFFILRKNAGRYNYII